MSKPITKKMIKKYLENPDICPYCGSDDIHGEEIDAEVYQAYREVECNDCEREWREVFTMTGIEEVY